MEKVKVLYIIGGIMSRGGIESYTMNYYRNIDKSKIQMDFVVHGDGKGVYDDEILSNGGHIYHVPIKSKDYFGNIRALKKIFLSGGYKIVHAEMDAMNYVVLKLAKKCGIPVRISHSHNTQHLTQNKIKYFINEYARKKVHKYATHLFACSELAGKWLYGEENYNAGNVKVINNAIELERFKFDEEKRINTRKELGIGEEFVIGHVGRLHFEKNHMFLIQIFKEILKREEKAKLVLIGAGPLEKQIKEKIKEEKLEDKIIMLKNRDDINKLMSCFDIFVLPSLFEGLPIVAIEAQANGLPCIFADTITKQVKLTDNVEFLKLEEVETWVDSIIKMFKYPRKDNIELLVRKGYSIKKEAEKLQDLYIKINKC